MSPPLTNTDNNYFGPLYVKYNTNYKKVWVCLSTYITVSAVYLELVEDMSAELFLEGLRRFIARIGKPDEIISDNATSFKAGKTIDIAWKDIISDPQVNSEKRTKWYFIIELSPWMGGEDSMKDLQERQKMAMKMSIGKMHLIQTQLQTMITEFEGTENSQPLVDAENDLENQIRKMELQHSQIKMEMTQMIQTTKMNK